MFAKTTLPNKNTPHAGHFYFQLARTLRWTTLIRVTITALGLARLQRMQMAIPY